MSIAWYKRSSGACMHSGRDTNDHSMGQTCMLRPMCHPQPCQADHLRHAGEQTRTVWELRCHKAWEKQFDRQQHGAWCGATGPSRDRHHSVQHHVNRIFSWGVPNLPLDLLNKVLGCFHKVLRTAARAVLLAMHQTWMHTVMDSLQLSLSWPPVTLTLAPSVQHMRACGCCCTRKNVNCCLPQLGFCWLSCHHCIAAGFTAAFLHWHCLLALNTLAQHECCAPSLTRFLQPMPKQGASSK